MADDPTMIRVLAIDSNSSYLHSLETLLRTCRYNVITAEGGISALQILRENRRIDLVMSEVDLPDMDSFMLLKEVISQMDIPMILVSCDDSPDRVMKGIIHGACDYLIKPVTAKELKNIWQHVLRKKLTKNILKSAAGESVEMKEASNNHSICSNEKTNNKEHGCDDKRQNEHRHDEASSKHKKPRIVWSTELHANFVAAVDQLGVNEAVPKRIVELMNVEGISREQVASHLQKYRIHLKRSKGEAAPRANNAPSSHVTSFGGAYNDSRPMSEGGTIGKQECVLYPPTNTMHSHREIYNRGWFQGMPMPITTFDASTQYVDAVSDWRGSTSFSSLGSTVNPSEPGLPPLPDTCDPTGHNMSYDSIVGRNIIRQEFRPGDPSLAGPINGAISRPGSDPDGSMSMQQPQNNRSGHEQAYTSYIDDDE